MARRRKRPQIFGLVPALKLSPKRGGGTTVISSLIFRFNQFSKLFLLSVVVFIAISTVVETRNPLGLTAIVTCLIGIICFTSFKLKYWLLQRRWLDGVEMQAIDQMDGHEFEKVCAEVYRRLGYKKVTVTQRSRDQGADLTMEGAEGRYVVQAKRQATPVGNWAVQEICAAKGFYKASHAIVVSNNIYTTQARDLAKSNAVELVDRNDFAILLSKTAKAGPGNVSIGEFLSLLKRR